MTTNYIFIIIIVLTIILIFVRIQVENYIEAKRFERLVMKMLEQKNREWIDKFEQALKKSFEDEHIKKILNSTK